MGIFVGGWRKDEWKNIYCFNLKYGKSCYTTPTKSALFNGARGAELYAECQSKRLPNNSVIAIVI